MREGGGAAAVGGEGAFLRREGASQAGRNGFGIFDGDANQIKGRKQQCWQCLASGTVRERDSRWGASCIGERKKGVWFFAIFRNGRKRDGGGGLKFLEDKTVFLFKFIQ